MDTFHNINIVTHVISGTIGLLLGVVAIVSLKGGKLHVKSGRWFLWFLAVVCLTGILGIFVFERNSFLIVITLLSAYQGFSGYRVLQTKSNQFYWIDLIAALLTITSCFYFLYYFQSIGMIWSPIIIYSTVGWLSILILYDFLKYLIPKTKYKRIWLKEHIVKMIGAFSALFSAFAGTVFEAYQPHSQYLPSVIGNILIIYFLIIYSKKK
ncbi:hypothetical protein AAON49_02360 [Pseudotenacibaculum sp. MALMAid0570]|uniref:hypothetical protein n=1 Tax=Pseudotenacibaculum sp. MALMAid0570 TaxID=3143938 RepID=UPI0032DF0A83